MMVFRRFTVRLFSFLLILITATVPLHAKENWPFIPLTQTPVIAPGFGGSVDAGGVEDPDILWDGHRLKLYYTAIDRDGVHRIALATSSNAVDWDYQGIVWNPGDGGIFDQNGVSGPSVVQTAEGYEMYYTGDSNAFYTIGAAVSEDGVTFARQQGTTGPVLGPSWNPDRFDYLGTGHPSVILDQNARIMMYEGYDGRIWGHLGLAVSPDGKSFLRIQGRDQNGAVLGRGPHGYDDGGGLEPELVVADEEIRLLYTTLHY
jgi:hypothetical protein